MSNTNSFFKAQTETSKLKADIVSSYFEGWANVMASQSPQKIAYLDLYSGPGRYDDDNPSTPLLVLEKALFHKNKEVPKKIIFRFNDADPKNVVKLQKEINEFPGVDKLKFTPKVSGLKISQDIVEDYEIITQMPTLSFIDPWGYKGLSLPLIRALVKDWGCDSIFFFNYKRINPGIANPNLQKPINLLFTNKILYELQEEIQNKKPKEREKAILRKVKEVFWEWGMKYVLPFPFKNDEGTRTNYYLIFITKNIRGFEIMENIMAKYSSCHPQGVPSFEYNPAAAIKSQNGQRILFELETPLDDLKTKLLNDFKGLTLTTKQIYEQHKTDKLYLLRNYKEALLSLEEDYKIQTNRAERKFRRGTFPDNMVVCFPKKET